MGDPVLQRIEVGNQVGSDTAVMGVGEGAGVAFYTRQQKVQTTIEISHYERDNITHYERDNIIMNGIISATTNVTGLLSTREKKPYTRASK